MQPQKIFETVAKHLFNQGQPALNSDGDCMYRGPRGTMCAVGCLIPDNLYDKRMESNNVEGILGEFKLPRYFKKNKELLQHLQYVHDKAESDGTNEWDFSEAWEDSESMRESLKSVARRHKLKYAFLKTLKFKGEE